MSVATTRSLASGLTAVALAAASTLLVAVPASAATESVRLADIAPDETAYLGWHFQVGAAGADTTEAWNGLRVGAGAGSYVLKGLVAAGTPGLPTGGTSPFMTLITGASITATGDVLLEVPYSVTDTLDPTTIDAWGTLRTADPLASGASPTPSTLFMSSRALGALAANTAYPLTAFMSEFDTFSGDVRYSGYGFYANAQFPPAVVSSMTFGGDTATFGRPFTQTAPSSTVAVKQADIRPDESTYPGWHEGYVNAVPAYEVKSDGLHLGGSANSQIIDGLATPLTSDPFALLGSYAVTVVSGEAFAQLPVFFGAGSTFTTLRSAAGYTAGRTAPALADLWQSSKAIPATATTAAIAANAPVPLGDLLEALVAHGDVQVLAFGVLAQSGAPAVVSAIAFNGVNYTFATAPEIAATGSELAVPLSIGAGVLLLLGAGLLLLRRRVAR